MEYFGLLSLGAAVAAISVRFYFAAKREEALESEEKEVCRTRKAKRAEQASLARRMLRYHLGLAHA